MKKESEIKVYAAHDKLVPLEKIIPNPRNPNTHPEKQIKLLAKIIAAQGWRAPISVSNRSGFIVRGHARLKAAQLLGLDNAPVDYQDYDSEAQEWADLIADNRIAELAEIDLPSLKDALSLADTGEFDIEITGFDEKEIEDLINQLHIPEDNKPIDEDAMKDTKNECPKCGFQW
jgi:ParB-like chromosome segregation protein Spo0J